MTTNKIPYPKQLISFTDQISLLKQRGMAFGDEAKALHLLQNISYYRLSGYWYPLVPRFCELLKRYPSIDVRAMGFPDNWKNENLWKDSF